MDYLKIFYDVLSHFGKAAIVVGAFYFGHYMSKTYKGKLKNHSMVLGSIVILSLVIWSSYGTHTENEDQLRGGGDVVTDLEPSEGERNEYGLTMFFVLTVPALFGLHKGKGKFVAKQ